MHTRKALNILDKVDRRIYKNVKNCVGTAVFRVNDKWRLGVFVKDLACNSEGKSIYDHFYNLRFNTSGARLVKDDSETKAEDLIPKILVGQFSLSAIDRTIKWRPAPGSVSIGHIDAYTTAGSFGVIVYRIDQPYDFVVSGDGLNPDCSGGFEIHTTYNGKIAYKHTSGDWYLWWHDGVPERPHVYEVTAGDPPPNPDCTGLYFIAGLYNGYPYWKHETEDYYLSFDDYENNWFIADQKGVSGANYAWIGPENLSWGDLSGNYTTWIGVTGIAVVHKTTWEPPPIWNSWVITDEIGNTDNYCWKRGENESIKGDYEPITGVEGTATVAKYHTGKYRRFILSNCHVLALLGSGNYGDPICQPGLYDIFEHSAPYSEEEQQAAEDSYYIGYLQDWVPLLFNNWGCDPACNHADAAICKPIDYTISGDDLSPECSGGYEESGVYNDRPYYWQHQTDQEYRFVLWWHKDWKGWVISNSLGTVDGEGIFCWYHKGRRPLGKYEPKTGTAGIPVCKIGALDGILELTGLTSTVEHPSIGQQVMKIGRTSGKEEGTIIGISGYLNVGTIAGPMTFYRQLITNYIGGPGDSGSLLVSKNGKRAVGLLFAGSDALQMVAYCPAICVEKELDITFARPRRLAVDAVTRKIMGKTVDGLRKVCNLCPAAKETIMRCKLPGQIAINPPDCDQYVDTTYRVQFCYEDAGGYHCLGEGPEDGCIEFWYTSCWVGSGVCIWHNTGMLGPFSIEGRCGGEMNCICYCDYEYVSDTCMDEVDLCSDPE